jgi:hypothetical protein
MTNFYYNIHYYKSKLTLARLIGPPVVRSKIGARNEVHVTWLTSMRVKLSPNKFKMAA